LEAPQADIEECGFNPSTTRWSNHYAAINVEPPKHHDAGHDNFIFYPIAPEAVHKGANDPRERFSVNCFCSLVRYGDLLPGPCTNALW
jgi:hypothetical protein